MNLHAWIVAATGLPPANVWEAYQDSAHEPIPGTDYVVYHLAAQASEVYLASSYELPENPNDPVPEDIEKTVYGETKKTVTLMVFGPNRSGTSLKIEQSAYNQAARIALAPSVLQRIVPGSKRTMRLPRERGWHVWEQFDIVIHEMEHTSEIVPTIQGSVIIGTVGNEPIEIEEP